ncbi:MAG: SPOR domain-containing protein, partial [Bacteroidota bacterium]
MRKTLLVCLWLGVLYFQKVAIGQSLAESRHYVIIGAFTSEANAERLTAKAITQSLDANYARNEARGVFYVYVLGTDDRKVAYAYGSKVRRDYEYKDAWVFSGALELIGDEVPEPQEEEEPVLESDPRPAVVEEVEEPEIEEADPEPEPDVEEKPAKDPNLQSFYFKLVGQESGEEVSGQVYLQKNKEDSQYDSYDGNQVVDLLKPGRNNDTYFVTINAPGYDPVETELKYDSPPATDEYGNGLIEVSLERS